MICHHSLVKHPQEDFKNLLDTAERKAIRLKSQEKPGLEKTEDKEDSKKLS